MRGILAATALTLALAAAVTFPASWSAAFDEPRAGERELGSLAIYQNGIALVTKRRTIPLDPGQTGLASGELSPGVLPETVDLAAEGVRVLAQQMTPWPPTRARLLPEFVGETVILRRPTADGGGFIEQEATLLSIEEQIVLDIDGRIEVDPAGEVVFPELPRDIVLDPEVRFRIAVDEGGERDVALRYLTRGLSWRGDYVAQWDGEAERLALTGLATIRNELKRAVVSNDVRLVAGEAALSPDEAAQDRDIPVMRMEAAAMPEPEALADFQVFPLDRPLRLGAGETVQRALVAAPEVAADARYRIEGLAIAQPRTETQQAPARLRLEIPDTRAAGIDRPLPAGTLRVYADGVFRGARRIDDTPVGGALELDLGTAFDITAESRQSDFERIGERSFETAREIVVRNAKTRAVEVEVVGRFPGDWRMIDESHPHDRRTATEPVWTFEVPAEGETTLTYRVRVNR